MKEGENGTLRFGEGTEASLSPERARELRDYRKGVLKELREGRLTEAGLIQRRMYWWMSKLVEWSVIPHTHW